MKPILLAAALFACSSSAFANIYLGVEGHFNASTELEVEWINNIHQQTDLTGKDELTYSILGGVNFLQDRNFTAKAEIEYRYLGEERFVDSAIEGNALFANVRVQANLTDQFYIGALLGGGYVEVESTFDNTTYSMEQEAYQYGVEAGFKLNKNLILNAGYKVIEVDLGSDRYWYSSTLSHDSVFAGVILQF